MARLLMFLVSFAVHSIKAVCRPRANLVLENVALRQQMAALQKKRSRPPLDDIDRAFWIALRDSWSLWANHLIIVNSDTVVKWNRERFRRH